MKQLLKNGKYIVAVSGGVDSVVLLNMLIVNKLSNNSISLVVAHYDHGIRSDSEDDRKFVQGLAKKNKLEFEYEQGNLGRDASEELARKYRYKFLDKIKKKYQADAIIVAHHKDDVLETVIMATLRGTGRRGLGALNDTESVYRPLKEMTKQQIIDYAIANKLVWREDATNNDQKYLRNWVRHSLVAEISKQDQQKLLELSQTTKKNNKEIDVILDDIIGLNQKNVLSRRSVINMTHKLSSELLAHWFRKNGVYEFDRKTIEDAVLACKTYDYGKSFQLAGKKTLTFTKNFITFNDGSKEDT